MNVYVHKAPLNIVEYNGYFYCAAGPTQFQFNLPWHHSTNERTTAGTRPAMPRLVDWTGDKCGIYLCITCNCCTVEG